jgi:hypothetical protein
MTGTWTSPTGTGTFVAQSATVVTGTGGTGGAGSMPSSTTVAAAAMQACQKAVTCGTASASSCTSSATQPQFSQGCWDKELAIYQCIIDNTCTTIQSACSSAYQVGTTCDTTVGTFNPALTGIQSFDDIVHLCTLCTTEAQACYNSADCKAYAVCVDACPTGDFNCGDLCSTTHSAGYLVYSDAATCRFSNC